MKQSSLMDFLNLPMKRMGFLQILEHFTDLKNKHITIKIFRLRE